LAEHALSGKYRRLIYKTAFSWGFVNARQNFVLRPFAELTRFLTCISIGRGVKKALEEQHIIQVRQTKSEMFYEN
jgi:hypothetical protein